MSDSAVAPRWVRATSGRWSPAGSASHISFRRPDSQTRLIHGRCQTIHHPLAKDKPNPERGETADAGLWAEWRVGCEVTSQQIHHACGAYT